MKEDIKKAMIQILIENGVFQPEEVGVQELVIQAKAIKDDIDSMTYISFLVSLENRFNIEFSEEILINNVFDDIRILIDYIDNSLMKKENS